VLEAVSYAHGRSDVVADDSRWASFVVGVIAMSSFFLIPAPGPDAGDEVSVCDRRAVR